jgi:YebC/PmpR family DNA-binding regulatory protein
MLFLIGGIKMAGHSKWSNIKHRKGKSDAEKGKLFTKLGRELAIAVKEGGPDPETNNKLKDVVAKAKAANMPNDNILRSIKKAAGDADEDKLEEVVYEGYGPGGVAVIVETLTDNRNRTVGDIRFNFDKYGGNLGQTGCVSFMFEKKGIILIERTDDVDEEELMMEAIEAGAEDFDVQDEYFEILIEPGDFSNTREALENKGYEFIEADIGMIPTTVTELEDPKHVEQINRLIDNLEDLDDVQSVYHNLKYE